MRRGTHLSCWQAIGLTFKLGSAQQAQKGTWRPGGYQSLNVCGEVGRYRDHPILSARDYEGRCLYVVEPAAWGHFARAQVDGDQDVRVDINPISIARAREPLGKQSRPLRE